jgi:hypothetical protein
VGEFQHPDDLLHHILSFLPTHESVRTSVLSRRWQRVWIGLPTFAFDDKRGSIAGFADSVDKMLVQVQGTAVDRLEISVRHPLHIARANEWLQHAAHDIDNIIFLFHENLPAERILHDIDNDYDRIVLHLPCGGRTTAMTLDFHVIGIATLAIPPAVPSPLTKLELKFLRVDASSLSNFVSSCCPHLRKLVVHTFGDMDVLKLSNHVLEDLDIHIYFGGVRRLEVWSRNLRRLSIRRLFSPEVAAHEVHDGSKLASFFTPRLEDIRWTSSISVHPRRIDFAHSLSTVRKLEVGLATHAVVHQTRMNRNKLAIWLLRRCTSVSCLKVLLYNLQPKVSTIPAHVFQRNDDLYYLKGLKL